VESHVLREQTDGVLTLTLNRPDKKNALTRAMYRTLGEAIDLAATDSEVRCVLIRAHGDIFTAGNDINDFAATSANREGTGHWEGNPLLAALARAKTPLVAAVQGRAVGVGVTMLLHCDLVYVSEDALLSTPFVNLGLVPEAASSLTLPARIGHARAFAMFVLGEAVTAQEAVAWGIANRAYPRAELHAKAREAAVAVATRPPAAVTITKALMRDPDALAQRMEVEGGHFMAQLKSPEAREAFTAFAEKRKPDFSKLG
jgi:enoyl-CoA hydratase/carnithine racemase